MKDNLPQIWEKTLYLIKAELTEVSFNTWIKTIEPISLENDVIILGAPNEFIRDILNTRYITLISNAIKQITSQQYIINLIIPTEENIRSISKNNRKNNNQDTTA